MDIPPATPHNEASKNEGKKERTNRYKLIKIQHSKHVTHTEKLVLVLEVVMVLLLLFLLALLTKTIGKGEGEGEREKAQRRTQKNERHCGNYRN